MRKPLSLAKIYSTIIISALVISSLFQLFVFSDQNTTSVSLLTKPGIQYLIAGPVSDKKQLTRSNPSLSLTCDARDLNSITMCGIVLLFPENKTTHAYPSFHSYDRITADIQASAETSRYSGKVTIFIKTIYDTSNPSVAMENTKYQAVKFNPEKIHVFNLNDFNVENWWLNKYDIPYNHSHRDLNNVVSLEVYISDIPLLHASRYQLKIQNLALVGDKISQKELYQWMSALWPILIIALLFHYFLHTRILLKKSKKIFYTDKETGFFNIEKLVRDYSDIREKNFQIHSLKIINYKSLCEKIGKKTTLDIINFTWHRCTVELNKKELVVYRIDDDEFIILKEGKPFTKKNYNLLFDLCSLGINISNTGQFSLDIVLGVIDAEHIPETAQQLIENSKLVTSYAKSHSQKLVHYGIEPLKVHREELFILNSMKKSMRTDSFYLQFMPIYNRKKKKISGVETILRSHSLDLSAYSPETYINIAERYGYIKTIDLWVIEETFKVINQYNDIIGQKLRFSINISFREMLDNSFIDNFKKLLKIYNINTSILCLEITETFFVDINPYEIRNIKELRDLGCSISLDDFGTGYTSFPSLLKLPANEIKIDKSYVSKLGEPHYDILIQSFINIAQIYNYDVVAEGIETKEQLEKLYQMGCNHFQGYYINKPADFSKIIENCLVQGPQTPEMSDTTEPVVQY
ncbi:EAL domain-containing protein [Vibrio salinus]|uniref:EAL domain-containing protein n=1 Tax=Vibrio salinus TaxID=2899784 RepID=UPI001E64A287|nr:EAL domain-containing protein [Vibrio salinus]MCE0496102.1 EAL domain-containing protein [Vibrio salinus]